jgi:hypothetical protein
VDPGNAVPAPSADPAVTATQQPSGTDGENSAASWTA